MPRKDRSAKLAKKDRVLAVHVTAQLMGARLMAAHITGRPILPEHIMDELHVASTIAVQLVRAVDRHLAPMERQEVKRKGTEVDRRHGGKH